MVGLYYYKLCSKIPKNFINPKIAVDTLVKAKKHHKIINLTPVY